MNTWVPAWFFSAGSIAYCIKKATATLKDKTIPLMGVAAAFIFAAQMVNFPILPGTSGHILGGALSAALLGPWAGAIVMVCVLVVQCFVFQDGGITALGANILNMAILGVFCPYIVYILGKPIKNTRGITITAFFAGWISVVISAIACAVELALSKTSSLQVILPAMVFIHSLIGLVEGIVTASIIGFIVKTRPDLIYNYAKK